MRVRRIVGGLATVVALGGLLVTPADGATPSEQTGCAPDPAVPKRQFRASWVASVVNIDWPSRTGLTAAQQQAELVGWLDGRSGAAQRRRAAGPADRGRVLAVDGGAVVEVPDRHPGRRPGWDPLAFAVAEAHRRNLELHGWFNPYRLSMDDRPGRAGAEPSGPGSTRTGW